MICPPISRQHVSSFIKAVEDGPVKVVLFKYRSACVVSDEGAVSSKACWFVRVNLVKVARRLKECAPDE